MLGTRHAASFIKNTFRPVILELDKVLEECLELDLSKESIEKWLDASIQAWLSIELIKSITFILVSGMFCLTVYFIIR